MKVSVCVPAYNAGLYLRQCIETVLRQTLTDFELIVCDNASTDQTWDILRSFSDPRIRCYRADQNRSMAANFDFVVSLAQGNYVKLLCADDLLDPTALEMQARFLDARADIALVTCATRIVNEQGMIRRLHQPFPDDIVLSGLDVKVFSLLYGNFIGAPTAVMFRRACYVRAGPFSDDLPSGLDWDMWLRMAEVYGTGYIATPLCSTRAHKETVTTQLRRIGKIHEDNLLVVDSILRKVKAGRMVRKVSLGRVAGSFVRQAIRGIGYGQWKWPLSALVRAFQIDPAFVGLVAYMLLFRTRILNIRAGGCGELKLHLDSWNRPMPAQHGARTQVDEP